MADQTIAEFLVGLKFKVDEPTWQRFQSTVESATLKAKLFGDALEAIARAAVGAVARTAQSFEDLFYASSRLGTSVESIRAFGYAVSQMGGTVAGAQSTLKSFGDWMRLHGTGGEAFLKGMGVATRDAQGHAIDRGQLLLSIGERLAALSKQGAYGQAQASNYARILGIDEETLLAIERPGTRQKYNAELGSEKSAGIGGPMAEAATRFEKSMRETWQRIADFAEGAEGKTFAALAGPLEKLNAWLDAHKEEINAALTKIADALGDVATKWSDGLGSMKPGDVAKEMDSLTKSLVDLVHWFGDLGTELKTVSDSAATLVKWMNWLSGVPGAANPMGGAPNGPAQKTPFQRMGEAESSPEGHSADTGFGAWIKRQWQKATDPNAPTSGDTGGAISDYVKQGGSWTDGFKRMLGGDSSGNARPDTGGHGDGPPGGAPVSQNINGAPVSEGNPVPTKIVGGDSGFFGWLKDALGIGGASAAEGGGGGGRGGLMDRLRGRGAGGGSPSGAGPAGSTSEAMTVAMDQLRKEGVPESKLHNAAAMLVGQAIAESGLRPGTVHDSGTGYGIYGARLERRDAMLAWMTANGYAKNSLEGQMRYMAHEAMTRYPRTRGHLMRGDVDPGSVNDVTGDFESPAVINNRSPSVNSALGAPLGKGPTLGTVPPLGTHSAPAGAGGDKHVSSNITNNITVTSAEPNNAAAAVGVHLDRTAADVYRNLQGAIA